jgi:tetratricopeptide (TPR) repeat protein
VLDPQDPLTIKVDQYFLRARGEDRLDPRTHTLYADFLVRCERYERAEDFYLRAIDIDPSYRFASLAYGLFLLLRKKEKEAEPYLFHATGRFVFLVLCFCVFSVFLLCVFVLPRCFCTFLLLSLV